MISSPHNPLRLHGYWRSGAAYRVRIALNLKGLSYEQISHDLRVGAQRSPDYLALAPQGLTPALQSGDLTLVQSPAILEWLDERWPTPPLLPADVDERAVVRAMLSIIACDIHPLNNLRVLNHLKGELEATSVQMQSWTRRWVVEGFAALELMIGRHGRGFAFGDHPTLADCALVPQVYSAERFGVELSSYPKLVSVAAAAGELPAFVDAHPSRQPDADPAP